MNFGPLLKLWSQEPTDDLTAPLWTVSVLVGIETTRAPEVTWRVGRKKAQTVKMKRLSSGAGHTFFRALLPVAQTEDEQTVSYQVEGFKKARYTIPKIDSLPRIAYGSCNGFHNKRNSPRDLKEVTNVWRQMNERHNQGAAKREEPLHLLILGGDQIYSDSMFDSFTDNDLEWDSWLYGWTKEHRRASLSEANADKLRTNFFKIYLAHWGKNEALINVMSEVPTQMMWDDHDIIDGWGSYEQEGSRSDSGFKRWPVYKELYKVAREAFLLFQQHCSDDEKPPHMVVKRKSSPNLSMGLTLGKTAILHLDTRSERTPSQILSGDKSWPAVNKWLDSLLLPEKGVQHLLVCVSVPMIYADFENEETLLSLTGRNANFRDDLRDHWRSSPHRRTREKFLRKLFEISTRGGPRITLISGDVHVAAHGIAELKSGHQDNARNHRIHQLVSSPIINKPEKLLTFYLEFIKKRSDEKIGHDITAQMHRLDYYGLHKHEQKYYLDERNYLVLNPTHDKVYCAEWHFENAEDPSKIDIHGEPSLHDLEGVEKKIKEEGIAYHTHYFPRTDSGSRQR